MPVLPWLLALLLLAPGSGAGDPLPATEQGLLDRARDLLAAGDEGRIRLAAEAAQGIAAARRAALEALATLPPAEFPPGTVEASLSGLGSSDPLLRRAALGVLLAAGPPALAALERLEKGPVEGLPSVPPARARDARFELRRAAVERDFLALWVTDDGTFHGMYASLKVHGPFGARVLSAIATDRRMAAGEVLDLGPYAWLEREGGERDRSDCRGRALEALADAGDAAARERLRPFLRHRIGPDGMVVDEPAPERNDDLDRNPIPAALDDAFREAIAAMGDPVPLQAMIEASERGGNEFGGGIYEMRRRASAKATLAAAAKDPRIRLIHLEEAEKLQRRSLSQKRLNRMSVDGVEHYNLACLLARRNGPGDREEALDELEIAVRTYSVSARWFQRDGDLASLHDQPRFHALVERLAAREKALEEGRPVPR